MTQLPVQEVDVEQTDCQECAAGTGGKLEDACSICLGDLDLTTGESGGIFRLPCEHTFHGQCIKGWILHRGMSASRP